MRRNNNNTVIVDRDQIFAWADAHGITKGDLARKIGKTPAYWSYVARSNGRVHELVYRLLLTVTGEEYGTFLPKIAESPAPQSTGIGYSLQLDVQPEKVRLAARFGGDDVDVAYAKVHGDTECDLFRAISYAADRLYQNAEQRKLAMA